jgi:hypothetical protein
MMSDSGVNSHLSQSEPTRLSSLPVHLMLFTMCLRMLQWDAFHYEEQMRAPMELIVHNSWPFEVWYAAYGVWKSLTGTMMPYT